MKRRDRPGVVDLGRYRAASKAPPKRRRGPPPWLEPGPGASWGVLLAIAVLWALVRMAGA